MKTYYINQKLISLADKYYVYNAQNEACLEVISNRWLSIINRILGGLFSLGQNLYIKNLDGSEFATIKKRTGFLLEKYDIFCGGKNIASIKQRLSAFNAKMLITTEKGDYLISGNIMGRDFSISQNSIDVARVKKTVISIKDRYALDIFEEGNDELFVSAVIAIDNSLHN